MIRINISRSVLEWLCSDIFPDIDMMATACINLHEKGEALYWSNVVVKFVLHQVVKKFMQRMYGKKMFITISMEHAEAICLYRFLFNFPIQPSDYWKAAQRQFIIDELHKQIINDIVIS
jgi:hypothetical protein